MCCARETLLHRLELLTVIQETGTKDLIFFHCFLTLLLDFY